MKNKVIFQPSYLIILACLLSCSYTKQTVSFVQKDNQIEVRFDDKLFTAYVFSPNLTKPILYPVFSPSGIMVNRGFPLVRLAGESQDHPHHIGLWFACDEVDGNNFWNTTAPPPQILHVRVTKMKDGNGKGILATIMHWQGSNGQILLEENRTIVFYPGVIAHTVDFEITLTTHDTAVVFHDTKEGLFAIRVADWLTEKYGAGRYVSSNGDETEANVWGKRANWVKLEGQKGDNRLGIVIMNHPQSTNFPCYWMTRGYGLFSANPIGQYVYQKHYQVENAKPLNLTLKQGETALFKFRVIIYEHELTKEQIERIFESYCNHR